MHSVTSPNTAILAKLVLWQCLHHMTSWVTAPAHWLIRTKMTYDVWGDMCFGKWLNATWVWGDFPGRRPVAWQRRAVAVAMLNAFNVMAVALSSVLRRDGCKRTPFCDILFRVTKLKTRREIELLFNRECQWFLRHVRKIAHNVYCPRYVFGPPVWSLSALTGRIFNKFDYWGFFENMSRKFRFNVYVRTIMGTLHEDLYTFMIISL